MNQQFNDYMRKHQEPSRSEDNKCGECGKELEKHQSFFCCDAHRIKYNNLQKTRGALVMPYLMEWRFSKGGRNTQAQTALCRLAGQFNFEDKQAGRKPFLNNHYHRALAK